MPKNNVATTLRTANLLGALAGEVSDRLQRMLQQHPNQTDSAAAALNLIGQEDGLSNIALSQNLQLSHTATVRLVSKLKAEGLVRIGEAQDKRAVAIRITASGRKKVRNMLVERTQVLTDIVGALSTDEQRQLDDLVSKMLPPLVTDVAQGNYICRLCNHEACLPPCCPVNATCEYLATSALSESRT
jgi:MarR family transcriptional regulator, negative regulator of the multidrug operon emrRAB